MRPRPHRQRPPGTEPEPRRRDASPEARSAEERRLFQRYRRFGDGTARERLIGRFLPLADSLARRYRRSREPLEDLVQVARLGLVKAVDRFDPDRGVAFTSFAVPTILGELRRHFRDCAWSVHVPRGMKQHLLNVDAVAAELAGRLGRSPTPAEIGEAASMSTEDVLEAMEAATTADAVSLDAPLRPEEDASRSYAETLGTEDDRLELVELAATIEPELRALPGRDRLLLHLRFVDDLTQSQIAEQVGISQMHVSRRLRRALDQVASLADAEPALVPARECS
ncbi:MAG: SigB/SigF/SigG family RNA polymerase sigma factor [Actinomycetota bacterium]|nr:SigB/SigF/SigG family RNA polymerase sigma factor [Actinomycetota bacterium]